MQCDPGQDFYAGACQSHIETLSNCPNPGAPTKYPAFSCDAGCYEMNYSVSGPASVCPGGIMVNGKCLIRLNVLDDTIDTFTAGNSAYKIWDGSALTEVVHVGNAGCANGQVAVSDTTSATGWKCENSAPGLWSKSTSPNDIYYSLGRVGIKTPLPAYDLDVTGTVDADTYCIGGTNCISAWPGFTDLWSTNWGHVYRPTGRVAVGLATTTTPAGILQVATDLSVDILNCEASFVIGTCLGAHIEMDTNSLQAKATNSTVATLNLQELGGNLAVDTNTLVVDSTNNRVGIGTASPSAKLDVEVSSGGAATIGDSYNSATGSVSLAMGSQATASGTVAVAIGTNVTASGNYSLATGSSSRALGYVSTAMGYNTYANNNYAVAMGYGTDAIGFASTAMGYETDANGSYSTAMGRTTVANGGYSTAMGWNTNANGSYSTAMGYYSTAGGDSSVAMGRSSTASGDYSTSMGSNNTASGNYSTAMGYINTSYGSYSTAAGYSNTANSIGSVAMGYANSAAGDYSVALGNGNWAASTSSTAMGAGTTASGYFSTTMGHNTTARAYASTVIGRYNEVEGSLSSWVSTDPLFVIGNGTSGSAPSNALTVLKNGRVGIGTSSPGHLLHVTGRMKIDSTDAGMWIEAGTNDWFVGRLNSNDNTDLRFYNSTDKFIFGRDGRLEIVNGPDNDGSTASLIVGDGVQTLYVDGNEIDGSSSLYIQHNSSNNLYLATGGGNVGVGTTSPSAKLHVNGHLRATTLGNWTNVFDEKTLAANTSDHFIAYCPAGYIPVSCGMISGQQNQNPAVYAPTLYAYSTYCSAYVRNTSAFSYIIQVFVKCFNPNA